MGGKPSKATPKDMRLKTNNPKVGKPKLKLPATMQVTQKTAKDGGY